MCIQVHLVELILYARLEDWAADARSRDER